MRGMYKIIRVYIRSHSSSRRAIKTNLTLEQAQAHCNDPETSSSTCTTARAIATTRRNGEWFDAWTEE